MYKNGAIRNLAMETPERQNLAAASEKDTSEGTPGPIRVCVATHILEGIRPEAGPQVQ